ncbi:hypothetical protein ACQRWP_23820 [Micromonospora trifolii]|uniref:hypothetical protein n=1 Tax=Micromonospora trifolii TaxID=2911208 RepID=UPI003D2E9D37
MSDTTDDAETRDWARRLFSEDEHDNWAAAPAEPPPPPDPMKGNHVPREGSTPSSSGGDWEARQWVNNLFTNSGVLG